MGSIPLDILMGEEALQELVLALDEKTEQDGWRVSSSHTGKMRDVLRQWLFRREKEYYSKPTGDDFFKFSGKIDPVEIAGGSRVQLEKLRLFSVTELSKEILVDDIDYAMDSMHRSMTGRYNAYVWAESESVQSQTVEYPADWWEAFKLRFMDNWPEWLQRKAGPVQYHYETMDVKAIYPTFRQKMPGNYPSRLIVEKRDGAQ